MAKNQAKDFRIRYRPYILAAVAAFVMTMFLAPEVHEGDLMAPTIKDGQVVVLYKQTYSVKRGLPDKGTVIVLKKNVLPDTAEDNAMRRVQGLPGDSVTTENGTITVGDDEVYVICDNQEAAEKGESGCLIKLKEIRGKARWIIWPPANMGGIQ